MKKREMFGFGKDLSQCRWGRARKSFTTAEWREESVGTALMDGMGNSPVCSEFSLSQCVSMHFKNISEKLRL